MIIPRGFWAIMASSLLLALLVILAALLLIPYIPQAALYGEIVGAAAVVVYCASQLVKLEEV